MKNQKDKLDELISSRIAERQRKLQRLQEMQGGSRKNLWVKFAPLAIAASLAVAAIIGSWQYSNDLPQDICRSASPEIQQLIDNKEWDKAYSLVTKEINDAESTISLLQQEDTTDEEVAYELQAERLKMKDMKLLEKEIEKKIK